MKPLFATLAASCLLLLSVGNAHALTLEDLRNDATLAPENFAFRFSNFKFAFGIDVQRPEDFLASGSGDCDDYSTLAASELVWRGYHARLISVRLKHVVHVVCYVDESIGYLDYNLRARGSGIVHCGSDLAEIADSVAKSFNSQWSSVSEFTYSDGVKRLVSTELARNRTFVTAPLNLSSAK